MEKVRVVVEYLQDGESPAMRWERTVAQSGGGAFELLGQAFEIAQRQDSQPFEQALRAFLKGAMVQREDVAQALAGME